MDEGSSSRMRWAVLVAGVVLGAFLRLHGLSAQIPMDDEWHGLDFALSRDSWFLFTHFSRAGANSIPFNLYLRGLLCSYGWTEVSIALPSLLAGIGLLWVFPRWVWRRFGAVAGSVTAALLAIAPFLIFYSRVARAYSAVLLLESLALIAVCEWLHTARRRHAVGLVVFGAFAIWVHASALPSLVAAVSVAVGHRWLRSRRALAPLVPRAWHVALAGLGMLALTGVLWLPALRTPMPEIWHAAGQVSAGTFSGMGELLSGTAFVPIQMVYLLIVLAGLVVWGARSSRRELLILGTAVGGSLLAVLAARPNASGISGVFIRYLLPAYLLASLAVGVAAEAAVGAARTRTRKGLLLGATLGLLVALFVAGPLPSLGGATNSFTKHPTFGFDYAKHDPDRARPDPVVPPEAPGLRRSELQPFYAELAREAGHAPVIEYPFILGEDANLLYFAQQVHGRPVLAGYYPSGALDRDVFGIAVESRSPSDRRTPSPGYITNAMVIDHVLGRPERAAVHDRIRFRTVVDIADREAVSSSRAQYLILHRNPLREFFHIGPEWGQSGFVARIRESLVMRYGAPMVENAAICVFRLVGGP
jgi:hypothetical protein